MTIDIASPQVSARAREAVVEVLESGDLADGEVVRKFESEFADYIGVEHAIATSSGTTALHAMLVAGGIGDGCRVLTTPFSFIATGNSVRHAGATPVFADIDPDTYNLDPAAVRERLQRDQAIDAIMPVHLYGRPALMGEFERLAAEFDCLLFEDAAQAHGAMIADTKVGAFGAASAFSFYPTKNMTTGEGGMVVTDDDSIASRVRSVINHGRPEDSGGYEHESVGYNFRMTNMQAAIGRDQLTRLDEWNERRRDHANRYTEAFANLAGITTPDAPTEGTHVYHQYTIATSERDRLMSALENQGIGFGIYYPRTIPDYPAYEDVEADTPIAERATERILSLPVHPHLTASDVERVIDTVQQTEGADEY